MAHVVRAGDEAIELAQKLAASLLAGAGERDRQRRLPATELDEVSAAGIFGITVPAALGGADVSVATLAEVFRLLATADASIAQIPQSHFVFLHALRLQGSPDQQRRFFGEALAGARFANAQSERGGKTVADESTTLRKLGDGSYLLDGEKFYCTGALYADWLVVRAVLAEPVPGRNPPTDNQPKALAFIRRATAGVSVVDDWDGMGQRTTSSGTVTLTQVAVPAADVVPYTPIFTGPTTYGSRAQLLHAAIDVGIARGALDAGVELAAKARPWFESGADRAADDPLLAQQAGELEIEVRAAQALLADAAREIDAAEATGLTDTNTAGASVATAVAKVACARAAVSVSSALFDLGGTRSAARPLELDRYWRDARTHTLHDPSRWKVQHVGRWLLSGTPPPRHGLL